MERMAAAMVHSMQNVSQHQNRMVEMMIMQVPGHHRGPRSMPVLEDRLAHVGAVQSPPLLRLMPPPAGHVGQSPGIESVDSPPIDVGYTVESHASPIVSHTRPPVSPPHDQHGGVLVRVESPLAKHPSESATAHIDDMLDMMAARTASKAAKKAFGAKAAPTSPPPKTKGAGEGTVADHIEGLIVVPKGCLPKAKAKASSSSTKPKAKAKDVAKVVPEAPPSEIVGKAKPKAKAVSKAVPKAPPSEIDVDLIWGCSKCRYKAHGCSRCHNPAYAGARWNDSLG